jgi:hypothetical protein
MDDVYRYFEQHGSSLLGYVDRQGNKIYYKSVINPKPPLISYKVIWTCARCNIECSTGYKLLTKRTTSKFYCAKCQSTTKFFDFETLVKEFASHDSILLGIKADDEIIIPDWQLTNKDVVVWQCKCGKESNAPLREMSKYSEPYVCRECAFVRYFHSMAELEELLVSKSSELISIVKNDKEILPPYPDGMKPHLEDTIAWRCSSCKNISCMRICALMKGNHFMCKKCRCKPVDSVTKYSQLFQDKGARLIGVVKNNNLIPLSDCEAVFVKDKVEWECAKCHKICREGLSNILPKDVFMCGRCPYKNESQYLQFKKELTNKGWSMVSPIEDYMNTKSLMDVVCNQDHPTQTSHNRFRAGYGCRLCYQHPKKKEFNKVKTEFEKRNFTLLETTYENNQTPMEYICKCGNHSRITYSNLMRNIDGCKLCSRKTRWPLVVQLVEDTGCKLLSEPKPFVLNSSPIKFQCVCKKEYTKTWKQFRKGSYCDDCGKLLREYTNFVTYGVPNAAQSDVVKQRIKDAFMDKYGVDHNMKNKECVEKCKATNIANHNGQHSLSTDEGRELSRQGNLQHYGVEYFMQSKEFNNRMIEKYGVPHAPQNPEILAKIQRSCFSTKPFIFPSGTVKQIQGYEHFALNDLIGCGITEDDICIGCEEVPNIKYTFNGKEHVYFPDIYIKSQDRLIEVKSQYTLNYDYDLNIAKFQAAAKEHNFTLWVYSNTGKRIDEQEFFNTRLVVE